MQDSVLLFRLRGIGRYQDDGLQRIELEKAIIRQCSYVDKDPKDQVEETL